METNKDLTIDEQLLPAGKNGLFTIPSIDEWTVTFNSNWNQYKKDNYDENDDILRFKVKPETWEEIIEHLEYRIKVVSEDEGSILLA